jgi:hypothetical protein
MSFHPKPTFSLKGNSGDTIFNSSHWPTGQIKYGVPRITHSNVVDPCSKSYKAGKYAAYVWGAAAAGAVAYKLGVRVFAYGEEDWHVGLELVGRRNLIHLGNSVKYGGEHLTIGYVEPKAGWFHIYFNRPWPWFYTTPR